MVKLFSYLCILLLFVSITKAGQVGGIMEEDNQAMRMCKQLAIYDSLTACNQWIKLPDGMCLQSGDSGKLVLELRNNLLLTGDLLLDSIQPEKPVYDYQIKEAVKRFQDRHGLLPDGIIGQQTLEELNVSPAERRQQLALNIVRWQSFYKTPARPTVFVNIPDFTLQLLNESYKPIWQTKVIVGLEGKGYQTLPMDEKITYMVFNPTWTIPNSIIRKEIIPIMRKDPGYLNRNRMWVYSLSNDKRTRVSSNSINWHTADPEKDKFLIIEQPGYKNSLGKMKFMFPNKYAMYLHDTPAKSLFKQHRRAYSHGCIRVQYPEQLASYLLSKDWTQPVNIRKHLQSKSVEKVVSLPRGIPIRIGYYTSWVNDEGILQFRKDIYKLDSLTTSVPLGL